MPTRLESVLQGQSCTPPPLWLMRQAGRSLPEYRKVRAQAASFIDFCLTPSLATRVTLQPLERFDLDAAILFSDILMVPYGLGQKVTFVAGQGPVLKPYSPPHIPLYEETVFRQRIGAIYETVYQVRQQLPKDKALIGFAGAPWTVACYMLEGVKSVDLGGIKTLAYQNPEYLDAFLAALITPTVDYLLEQVKAGCSVLQIFDSWAGVLPEPFFSRFIIHPMRQICLRLKKVFPQVPLIYFPKGCVPYYNHLMASSMGFDAISLDCLGVWSTTLRPFPQTFPLQGGLDPHILRTGGECLEQAIGALCSVMAGRPYIFNLSHGVLPDTPVENIAHLVRCVREKA